MKYKIEIRSSQKSKRLFLPMLSMYPHCFGQLEAIIDTGSPRTVLSAADACRLKIPFKNFQSTDPIRGYGKGGCPALKINKFLARIKSLDSKSKKLEFPITVIDFPTLNKLDAKTKNNAFKMPTIIGLDFLEFNKLSLFVDVKRGVAFLEDED